MNSVREFIWLQCFLATNQIYSMADYDISGIEHEALLFCVGSTFGNGDPPESGEQFAQGLYAMKMQENESENHLG